MTTQRTASRVSSLTIIDTILAANLATSGTVVLSYPAGKNRGNFLFGTLHAAEYAGGEKAVWPRDFTIALNSTNITVTWRASNTIPAGTRVRWQFDEPGDIVRDPVTGNLTGMPAAKLTLINLGAPIAIDDDGICASQNRTGAGALLINGALASGGVCELDVPRNVIIDSGGADTAVITVVGTDVYGQAMREEITLNGITAVSGKKAFKRITSVSASATISNGFFMGQGDVLGLPVFLPAAGLIVKELEDLAAATTGTTVAGSLVAPSATSADVRGTYDPNSAADGSKTFQLLVALPDPGFIGGPQYNG